MSQVQESPLRVIKPRQDDGTATRPAGTPAPDAIAGLSGNRSYHGQPVLKEPVWTWEIPCYFYTGGLAGASAGLAWLSGMRGNELLARRAWTLALAGGAISPVLLISDLGRPARFLNMLRMFKITSPMSVGSWVLAATGPAAGLSAVNAWTGWFPRLARLARPSAAALGLPLSTYTAALIANTSIPAWHEARRELPFLFAAGAGMSAGAAAVMVTPVQQAGPARRLALAGAVAELVSSELTERRLGANAEPYRRGTAGVLRQVAQAAVLAGAGLLATRGARSRRGAVAAGMLLSAGALSMRWAVFRAGFEGVADPSYVVGAQRERLNSAQGSRAGTRSVP